jgi:hypothetical protein
VVYKQLELNVQNIRNKKQDEVFKSIKKVIDNYVTMMILIQDLYLKLNNWRSIRKKLMRLLLIFKSFNHFIKKNHGKCLIGHP